MDHRRRERGGRKNMVRAVAAVVQFRTGCSLEEAVAMLEEQLVVTRPANHDGDVLERFADALANVLDGVAPGDAS